MALAFARTRPFMASVLIGATSVNQLETNMASIEIKLSEELLIKAKTERDDVECIYSTNNSSIASFDSFGNLKAKGAGRITISAKAGSVTEKFKVRIVKNPVRSVSLDFNTEKIRTGDVLHLKANGVDGSG